MDQEIEGQRFVSSREINKEREEVREARETILRDAERKYQARVEREEQKVSRGDHKWMLPDLDKDLDSKKKKKKHKKEKKKKNKKHSGSEDDWVESDKNTSNSKILERDSFMEFGFLATYSKGDIQNKKNPEKAKEIETKAALAASRELNPLLRDKSATAPASKDSSKICHGGQGSDGGLSWLLRAFKRAEDQAKEGGQSLEEIAERRWGSVETFMDMVSKAKMKASFIDRKLHEDLDRLEKEYRVVIPSNEEHRENSDRNRNPHNREERKVSSRHRLERSRSRSKGRRNRSPGSSRDSTHQSRRERFRSRHRSRSKNRKSRSRSKERADISRNPRFAKPGERSSKSSAYSFNQREGGGSWKSVNRREKEQEEGRKKERVRQEQNKSSDSSSEEEEEGVSKKDEVNTSAADPILTESELNTLASKLMKAEIMGNDELAAELKLKLEGARTARADMIAKGINPDQNPEILTKVRGENMKQKRKKTKVETHKDGERVRYFGDDEKYDLKQMFEREKMNTAEDQHGLLSRLAGKAEKTNDDYDMDDMIITKAASKQSEELEDIKRKNKAVSNQLALEKTLQDCKWCIGSKRSQKHLMVSMGKSVYLALPGTKSLVQGHCLIVPMGHCTAATELDEDVWNEVQDYRKALVKMFLAQDEDCVFFETAMGFKKHPHMVIECVPVPEDMGSMLPMYFQKAIQECEMEWSNNKKLVKLKEKNIARNIPRGLPYFHVDFGIDLGFAHVIEEEEDWNKRFGHEVVGGMLDTDVRTMRNPPWEQFEEQKKKVIQFGGMWAEYDWTKSLKSASSRRSTSSSDSD